MKLGDHKRRKVAEPDFWGNFSFVPNLGIWVPNGPLRKMGSLILAGNALKLNMTCGITGRDSHLGKSRFAQIWKNGPKLAENAFFW